MPDIREEFEAWYTREFFDGDKECAAAWMITDPVSGGYLMERPAQYLSVWQASRAALLKDHVPMPRQCPSWLEDAYDDVACPDTNYIGGLCLPAYEAMLEAQDKALQRAGIEVK